MCDDASTITVEVAVHRLSHIAVNPQEVKLSIRTSNLVGAAKIDFSLGCKKQGDAYEDEPDFDLGGWFAF